MCAELFAELADVLTQREKIRQWISLDDARTYLDAIRVLVDIVPTPPVEDVGLRDSADSYIVALARKESCVFIVTGDRDLLEWTDQRPPCIVPAAFLVHLQSDNTT